MTRDDLTVIYYTSNAERPAFEAKITQTLKETIGDLPLISVSQRPMDLGRNICVGAIGQGDVNYGRQFQIGVQAATTPFICTAESDCLYPAAYFTFQPADRHRTYYAQPVYVVYLHGRRRRAFYPKENMGGAIVVGREHMLEILERFLVAAGQYRIDVGPASVFEIDIPVLTFKTPEAMHRNTTVSRSKPTVESVPHWGTVDAVRRAYCDDETSA